MVKGKMLRNGIAIALFSAGISVQAIAAIEENDLAERLAKTHDVRKAKNVILFVGDGMGVSTVTAGRILEGQMRGNPGEENYLSFERFPYSSLVKTYNYDSQVSDSAGTASAMNTGIKSRIGTFGVSPYQPSKKCEGSRRYHVPTLAEQAERAGMSTGIVTTARLTHATPAAVYAHSPSRDWESDTELTDEAKRNGCEDIASQLLSFDYGDGIDVALGGGRKMFRPAGKGPGVRKDGRDLIEEWRARGGVFVGNRNMLLDHRASSGKKLLGLFSASHLPYVVDRAPKIPSLSEMTEVAIKKLLQNDNGFYLMVEAGRIDHAHHDGNAYRALNEVIEFHEAVNTALELVGDDTLIMVTADHSHVFTMAGYPDRGNPIFGTVKRGGENVLASDDKPYTTLGYQNGPGAINGERPSVTDGEASGKNYKQQAVVPLWSETHAGEDVPIYATGPWAHLVTGTMDQTMVFHIMKHALGFSDLD